MTANTATATLGPPTSAIAITAIDQMTEDDLKALYRTVKERLRLAHLISTDNINVMSVRLSLDTCNKLRQLAFARHTTLSDIARHAIDAYCKKENAR